MLSDCLSESHCRIASASGSAWAGGCDGAAESPSRARYHSRAWGVTDAAARAKPDRPSSNRVDKRRRLLDRRGLASLSGARIRARNNMGSEEHTSELKSLMRSSYAVLCLKKSNIN